MQKTTCKANLNAKYRVCDLTSNDRFAKLDAMGEPVISKGERAARVDEGSQEPFSAPEGEVKQVG